jgi:hypothetical protein
MSKMRNPERRRTIGRRARKWENNIKMGLKETGSGDMD